MGTNEEKVLAMRSITKERWEAYQILNGIHCILPMLSGTIKVMNCETISNEEIWFDTMHVHKCDTIMIVLDGNIAIQADDNQYQMERGDALFLHSGVCHQQIENYKTYGLAVVFHFVYVKMDKADQIIEEYTEDEEDLLTNLFSKHCEIFQVNEDVWKELDYLTDYSQTGYIGNYLKQRNCLDHLLMSLCQSVYPIRRNPMHSEFYEKYKNENKLYMITCYIREHISEEILLDDLANHIHYTPRHVQRLIMDYYGMSITKMLLGYRISKAKQLLGQTEESIDRVAEQSGFGCARNLQKNFRPIVGVSPMMYRRNVRKSEKEIDENPTLK